MVRIKTHRIIAAILKMVREDTEQLCANTFINLNEIDSFLEKKVNYLHGLQKKV